MPFCVSGFVHSGRSNLGVGLSLVYGREREMLGEVAIFVGGTNGGKKRERQIGTKT